MTKRQMRAMSPAETEILRLTWHLGEATVQQICDQLPPKRKIGYKTVQTLLGRLENKGYLKHRTEGKAYVFFPAVSDYLLEADTLMGNAAVLYLTGASWTIGTGNFDGINYGLFYSDRCKRH